MIKTPEQKVKLFNDKSVTPTFGSQLSEMLSMKADDRALEMIKEVTLTHIKRIVPNAHDDEIDVTFDETVSGTVSISISDRLVTLIGDLGYDI